MSLCKWPKSLPGCVVEYANPKNEKCNRGELKGIPSCACRKGSFTLEATVIMPLFAAFIVSLLFFFRVMQIETEVAEALSYAGRMTAVEASLVENDQAQLASAEVFFRKEMGKYSLPKKYILGNGQGISLMSSEFDEEYIKLKAIYFVKLPVKFFKLSGVTITQQSVHRKWVGDDDEVNENDPYVYYTDTGKVYHITKSCPYLDLSIKAVKYAEIKGLRNKSGSKYSACSKCVAKISENSTVYITNYGTLYHSSIGCSRLKRTVHTVHLSEVGDRPPCSKCSKGKNRY